MIAGQVYVTLTYLRNTTIIAGRLQVRLVLREYA